MKMTKRKLSANAAIAVVITTAALLPCTTTAQTSAFTRQVECPSDSTLTGYTSISNVNEDMNDELARVLAGGDAPARGYELVLCPGTFDATADGGVLRPVLDQVNIRCGDGSFEQECIIDGNQEQLIIENPTDSSYTLSAVQISGVTFNGLSGGVSAQLRASEPTVFTCQNCIWQDFDSEFVVNLSGSMTFRVEDGLFRVSTIMMAIFGTSKGGDECIVTNS